MILTVTANPLIDRTLVVNSLQPGKILRATHVSEIVGGKGINVARIVKVLGEDVHAISFVGGYYGGWLQDILELDNIPNTLIRTLSPTRFQVSILDNTSKTHTDIIDPGSYVSTNEIQTMIYESENLIMRTPAIKWLVLSGSTPQGKVSNLYYDLIKLANKYNVKTVLDSYGEFFKMALKAKPYIVKQNKQEAETLLRKPINSKVKILDYIKKMWDIGIALPILTMGKDGAIAGYQNKIWEIKPPKVKIVNATGSGDAFIGTLVVKLSQGKSMEESLCWATAAGAANATVWIPCGCTQSQIRQILPKVKIQLLYPS